MKSVMYHYVQKFNPNAKYANYLDYRNFEKQIVYFKSKFKFFNCYDVENFFNKENFSKKIFLTFDDSLKCHYNYVTKILIKHKINGIFYIPSLPYINKKILNVHKIHLILGKIKEEKAFNKLKEITELKMLDKSKESFFKFKIYKRQKNNFKTNYFKKFLNYYVKEEYRGYLTNKIFKYFFSGLNEETFCNSFYLNEKEIKNMSKYGMVFGGHSISHPVLSRLNRNQIMKEIKTSVDFASSFSPYKTFAYPYGGFHSFNKFSENFLSKIGVKFSLNVENKDINYNNMTLKPHVLSRYDCNFFKYGKASIKK